MDPIHIYGILGILAFLIVNNKLSKIIMKQEELADGLNTLSGNIDNLDASVIALGQAIKTNPEAVPQNVVDAYNNTVSHFQKLAADFITISTPAGNGDGSAPGEGSAPAQDTTTV